MNRDVVTAKRMVSHRLIIKLDDGSFRSFLLNIYQADMIAANINSVEPFIVLPDDIDPDSPTFYPKRGAWMEKLTEDEKIAYARRHDRRPESNVQDELKAAESKRVHDWIETHAEEFGHMREDAELKLLNSKGIFHSASKNVKENLIWWEARRMVADSLTQKP